MPEAHAPTRRSADGGTLVTLDNCELRVVVSRHGAELASLRRNDDGVELLWQGDPSTWPRRAPWLFPIVGRLRGDRARYRGAEIRLPQHGFARDRQFELVEAGPASASFRLVDDTDSRTAYPFPFVLDIGYRLTGTRLAVELSVENPGEKPLPFSLGGHPGFRCPLTGDEDLTDYRVELAHPETVERRLVVEGLIGAREPFLRNERAFGLSADLFRRGAVVLDGLRSDRLRLVSARSGRGVELAFPGFPYLGVWSRPPGPFVCLEPWCGIADGLDATGELERKEGIVTLEPGRRFVREIGIEPLGRA